jgi:1-acyl-sn-glycerol-3-phosphate acyltransferase
MNAMMKAVAGLLLKLAGWRAQPFTGLPEKCIIVCYPHTSNWDLILVELAAFYYGHHLNWLGKKEIFAPGVGWLMRAIGGIPVDRSAPQGMVKQVADEIRSAETVRLCIPPEGTRSKSAYWKSGFYHIAMEAGVPLQIAALSYAEKYIGFGETLHPTGDIKADMEKIREMLANNSGRFPQNAGPIRVKEEDRPDEAMASRRAAAGRG